MLALLVVSILVYCAGCVADAYTSMKFDGILVYEKSKIYSDKSRKFVLYKYVLLNGVGVVAFAMSGIYGFWLLASLCAIGGGVYRFWAADHNMKLLKAAGLW